MSIGAVFQAHGSPEDVEFVLCANGTDYERLYQLDGTPQRDKWVPIPVTLLRRGDRGEPLSHAELPFLVHNVLVLTGEAVSVLQDLLEPCGELLPLSCEGADLFVYHVVRIVDALDEDRSELVRFPSSGRILNVLRYVLRPEAIEGVHVFRLPQKMRNGLYVSSEFVAAVQRAGLQGTEFRQIWVPDSTSAADQA